MQKFLVVTECAIENDGKFLIITRSPGGHAGGLLAFPGGKVEYSDAAMGDDILIEAAKREVAEELGIDLLDPLHFITSSYFIDPGNAQVHILDVLFYCKVNHTQLNIKASKREVAAYHWLSREEIDAAPNSPVWLQGYIKKICDPER